MQISMSLPIYENGISILDMAHTQILDGDVHGAVHFLVGALNDLRLQHSRSAWKAFAEQDCMSHPLAKVMHQDPFTYHSFSKPRGYAGDAALLDLIYGDTKPVVQTQLGSEIFQYTRNAPSPNSVRARRDYIATIIDEIAEHSETPRMLSVACGHLREGHLSKALREKRIAGFFALDADERSLGVVRKELRESNVSTIHGSVRSILSGKICFNDLDFVYAAGLYDYLSDPVAKRLTHSMFNMLRPGGRLVVANFLPTTRDIGYMESYMGWSLIYRDASQMNELLEELPLTQVGSFNLKCDIHCNVIFLEVHKLSA